MTDSAAERSRRAYRHKRGDHTLCDPARRCDLLEQAEAIKAVARESAHPDGRYGPRGNELFEALTGEAGVGPLQRVLLDEACRVVDRLDRLAAALEDKGTWLRYERDDGGTVVITIDSVLSETRQQEMALRSLLADLEKAIAKAAPVKTSGAASRPQPSKRGGGLGDLNARIAARRASAPSAG